MSDKQLESLVYAHIKEILLKEVKSSDVCLDLGCGPGQYKLIIPGKYIGLDITAQNYRPDLPRRADVVADAQNALWNLVKSVILSRNLRLHGAWYCQIKNEKRGEKNEKFSCP